MGFLDKAKQVAAQAESKLNTATSGAGGAQQTKVADTWLKELGQWVYTDRTGRDPRAAAEIEVRIQQLQQWEQQNGTQVSTPVPSPGTGAAQGAPGSPPTESGLGGSEPIGGPVAQPSTPQAIPGTMDPSAAAPQPIPGTLSDGDEPSAIPSPPGPPPPPPPPPAGPPPG